MVKGPSGTNWEFDGFRVMTEMRLLLAGGTAVPLTSKAFDTLVVLIENRDRVVTKDELLRSVWPDVEVEEGNLTQQIFLLRKALGETAQQPRYIVTVPGHGYRFTARVTAISEHVAAPPAAHGRGLMSGVTGLAGFGVIALLAAALGLGWFSLNKPRAPVDFTHVTKLSESGKATFSAISRDGRYVALVENDGDQYSLWRQRIGAEGRTQVVAPQPLPMGNPSFSPDGEYLYFGRQDPDSAMGILYRIPVMGGPETPILEDVDTPPSFSPDGREFVFVRGGAANNESHIVLSDADGHSERVLARVKEPLRFTSAPDWAPDGKVIAGVVTDRVTMSKAIVLITRDGASHDLYRTDDGLGRLRWLPDGSGLLTVKSKRVDRRVFGRVSRGAVWRIDYPSGRAERLTSDLANHDPCCLDIDANGRSLVNVVTTFVSDLWVAPADRPDERTQVTADHPVVFRHAWLTDNDTMVYHDLIGRLHAVTRNGRKFSLQVPEGEEVAGPVSTCGDGRYVVFSTLPSRNIWRVNPNAGGAEKLTHGFMDINPACSPDGKWVSYASGEPEQPLSLWRVSIDGGAPAPLGLVDSFDVLPSPSGGMLHYTTDALEARPPAGRSKPTRAGALPRKDRWVVVSSSDGTRILEVDRVGDTDLGMMTNWAPDESGLDYIVTRNGVSNIWRQPLTGGPPVQITRFSTGRIFSFAWSRDGRWLSLASGFSRSDVVLMSSEP